MRMLMNVVEPHFWREFITTAEVPPFSLVPTLHQSDVDPGADDGRALQRPGGRAQQAHQDRGASGKAGGAL